MYARTDQNMPLASNSGALVDIARVPRRAYPCSRRASELGSMSGLSLTAAVGPTSWMVRVVSKAAESE